MVEERREYIIPVRFDDTKVPGLPEYVSYLNNADYNPKDLVEAIAKKLAIRPASRKATDERERVGPIV